MNLHKQILFFIPFIFTGFFYQGAHALNLTESWYMHRGRSNMAIGNYKAAAEAFEKVVEKDPSNLEAVRGLGFAYEAEGLKDKSIEQFDHYLSKKHDDPDIAFKQAQSLEWSRYSYRRGDIGNYYRMGLAKRNDPAMRLRYANFLAQKKETCREAVSQYDRVLAEQPHNAQAHRGLAKTYAWLGENDKALYQLQLADKYGSGPSDSKLHNDLTKGRETVIQPFISALAQSGGNYDLDGIRMGAGIYGGLTPFLSGRLNLGYEDYWNTPDSASGGFIIGGMQYRFDEAHRTDIELGYHSLSLSGGDAVGHAQYEWESNAVNYKAGFKRELRYDSFMALVGSNVASQQMGEARNNLFYTEVNWDALTLTPFLGWVSTVNLPDNGLGGVDGLWSQTLNEHDDWQFKAEYVMNLSHYANDQSGFGPQAGGPAPGGYFSPSIFWNNIPRLKWIDTLNDSSEFSVAAGPAIQYASSSTNSGFNVGADAHGDIRKMLSHHLTLHVQAEYTQITSIYQNFGAEGFLIYTP